MRNNKAIADEIDRLSQYLNPNPEVSCPNETCLMHGVPVSEGGSGYAAFGKTAAGTPRWRCNICKRTFTEGGKATKKHKLPHKNRDALMLLVSKSSISSSAAVASVHRSTIYGKLNFIHKQALLFAQNRERQLLDGTVILPKMYVAVDRQVYTVNWDDRKARRNIQLNAIGTADLKTGYVFGLNLNFDNSIDQESLDEAADKAGDYQLPEPYRTYSRYWLRPDYVEAIQKMSLKSQARRLTSAAVSQGDDPLIAEIKSEYLTAKGRDDIEDTDEKNTNVKLPMGGVQVREQYCMQAHFLLMAKMLASAPKVRVFMDQDSGFRASFMSAYHDRIKTGTADGWYVKVLKEVSIDEKRSIVANCRKRVNNVKAIHGCIDDHDAHIIMAKQEMAKAVAIGYPDDWWLEHPVPNASEPGKRICWLTNRGQYDEEHAARLYLKASLHAIDRFFMLIRRKVAYAERAVGSASQEGRKWYGYSAYKPSNLAKMLELYRIYFNYCHVGKSDGKTPAMRLGLAKGPVKPEQIIYFEPTTSCRKPRFKKEVVPKKMSVSEWLDQKDNSNPWVF